MFLERSKNTIGITNNVHHCLGCDFSIEFSHRIVAYTMFTRRKSF